MRNHLDLAADRTPPAHVLAGLRAVDPDADLHYVGEGVWMLGVVRARSRQAEGGRPRRLSALKILQQERKKLVPDKANVLLAEAMLRDFFEIARYRVQGEPTSAIVHDFAERDWMWKYRADEAFEANLDATENGPQWRERERHYADYAQTEARSAYRYTFKGRRSIGVNGLRA